MEEKRGKETTANGQDTSSGRNPDLAFLLVLLVLTVSLRAWILYRTEVAARDSIGYIRYALEFEKLPWGEVLRKNHQHPGYPWSVLAVSWPVRYFHGGTTPQNMQLSAQIASSLSAILLIIPMFYLGKFLVDRQTGFWATLLFQCLPVSGHLLSDGVSEPLFLLLGAWAMLWASRALQGESLWPYVWCGVFSGLAYLTRPEGAIFLLAPALALLGVQISSRWRRSWKKVLACQCSLFLPALLVGSLYFATTLQFSGKPNVQGLFHDLSESRNEPVKGSQKREKSARPAGGSPTVLASIWAVNVKKQGTFLHKVSQSLWGIGIELANTFHYVWGPAVLLGLWWWRHNFFRLPGAWVLLAVCLLYGAALCYLGMKAGYISDRHVLVVVLLNTYPAVVGVRELPGRALGGLRRLQVFPTFREKVGPKASLISLLLLLLLFAFCLPKLLQPLHGNRAGHHAAGIWLARHVQPGDQVKDDHCWAHFYAGQVFEEGKPRPAQDHSHFYVVISRAKDPENAKLRDQDEHKIRSEGGKIVFHWPGSRPEEKAHVVVYALAKP